MAAQKLGTPSTRQDRHLKGLEKFLLGCSLSILLRHREGSRTAQGGGLETWTRISSELSNCSSRSPNPVQKPGFISLSFSPSCTVSLTRRPEGELLKFDRAI